MTPTLTQIVSTIEEIAPLSAQQPWDNSGWQILTTHPTTPCTGATIALDITPQTVDDAIRLGHNLIISHHPLIFKGLKTITTNTPQQQAIIKAIRHNINIYSTHTPLDTSPQGTSQTIARALNLQQTQPLDPETSLGIIGNLATPVKPDQLIHRIKTVYQTPHLRTTDINIYTEISRIALCTGSAADLIPQAIAAQAQTYITSDIRYHTMADHSDRILLIDIGHYESEQCAKTIICDTISKKFPNFAATTSPSEKNPIKYP